MITSKYQNTNRPTDPAKPIQLRAGERDDRLFCSRCCCVVVLMLACSVAGCCCGGNIRTRCVLLGGNINTHVRAPGWDFNISPRRHLIDSTHKPTHTLRVCVREFVDKPIAQCLNRCVWGCVCMFVLPKPQTPTASVQCLSTPTHPLTQPTTQ